MLAGPNASPRLMRSALYTSIIALGVAAEIDIDRTPEDKAFFEAEKTKLQTYATELDTAINALDTYKTFERRRLQKRVEFGDVILDNGTRAGNTRTKLALKGKPGLGASHAFGKRIEDLLEKPMVLQPSKVLDAVEKLNDVAEFPEKSAIQQDLTLRANQQIQMVDEREDGMAIGTKLSADVVAAVMKGALALAQTKGALDTRFPRQRKYVATFFLDVAPERKAKAQGDSDDEDEGEGGGGSENG